VLRVRGAEEPFVAEIDANVRLPRAERVGPEQLEAWPLSTPQEVSAVVAEVVSLCELAASFSDATLVPERALLHAFSDANSSADSDLLVIDTEYQYGKRRFDFVAMKRAEGVAGPGGFTTPRLVVGQFKSAPRPLGGTSGLAVYASDFAEFARALSGTHLAKAKDELADLFAQKQRLGLASTDIPLRHLTEDDPEYLVVLAGLSVSDEALDPPLIEMHEKIVTRHYRPELLRLASVQNPGSPDDLRLTADDVMTYREFKGYRKRLRG